jgi:hypothetical protein
MESKLVIGVSRFNELVCTFADPPWVRCRGPTSFSIRPGRN